VPHHICQFHVVKDIVKAVLSAVSSERKRLAALHRTVQQLTAHAMQENAIGPAWRLAEHALTARNARNEDARGLLQRLRAGLSGDRVARRVA